MSVSLLFQRSIGLGLGNCISEYELIVQTLQYSFINSRIANAQLNNE